MKILKKFFVYSCAVAMSAALFSCEKDENGENPGDADNPNTGVEVPATPAEQKAFIEKTAQQLNDLLKPEDQAELVNFLNAFAEEYGDFFDDEDMYAGYDYAKPRKSKLSKEMKSMLVSLNKADWMGVTRSIRNVTYQIADFTGIFQPDMDSRTWIKTGESSSVIYRCKVQGKDAEISVVPSGGEYSDSFTGWDYDWGYDENGNWYDEEYEVKYTVKVPRNVKFDMVYGGKSLANGIVVSDYDKAKSAKANVNANIANIKVIADATLDNSKCDATYSVEIGGTNVVTGSAQLTGNHLCDLEYINNLYADEDDDDWDDDEYVDPAWSMFSTGAFNANILGRMFVKASNNNLSDLMKTAGNADDENESEMKTLATYLNNNIVSAFYLGGAAEPTGNITWRAKKYTYNWGGDYNYTYWSTEPMLTFKDGTTYSFEEYFSEKNFGDIVKMYESLVNTYKSFFRF